MLPVPDWSQATRAWPLRATASARVPRIWTLVTIDAGGLQVVRSVDRLNHRPLRAPFVSPLWYQAMVARPAPSMPTIGAYGLARSSMVLVAPHMRVAAL